MQAIRDRQESGFQVCERMFNALLAWATTRDVRYLLAAQRSLTAVQNQEGDTALHLAIIHNHQDVVLQLLDVLPQLPPTETPVVDCVNNFKQVCKSVGLQCPVWKSCVEIESYSVDISPYLKWHSAELL